MDSKDFDKIFSDKLHETQSFEFRESDWEEVSERLKEPKRKKRGAIWFWMLGAACLLLGLATTFLAIDLDNTKQELAEIKEAIIQQPVTQSPEVTPPTTDIATEKTTTTTSTENTATDIVTEKTTTTTTTSTENTATNIATENTATVTSTENTATDIATEKTTTTTSTENTATNITTENTSTTTFTENTATDIATLTLRPKTIFPLKENKISPNQNPSQVNSIIPTKKETKQRHRLGLMTAWSLPERVLNQDLSDGATLKRNAYDFGLHYNFNISKRISTWASVSLHSTIYKTENLSSREKNTLINAAVFGANEGSLQFQNADAQFEYSESATDITTKRNSLAYNLGVNYAILQKERGELYTGLFVHARTNLNSKIFTNGDTNNAISLDSSSETKSRKFKLNDASRFHALAAQIGYRFELNKRLSCQVEAFSQFKLARESNRIYEPFGLRTVLAYKF